MILTADEVAMFYAIYTCAERVDWACYESFRLRILAAEAELKGAHLAAAAPALNTESSPSPLPQAPVPHRVLWSDRA
jgi:hypothetical protein